MNVVLYVMNDLSHDARVRREAASLVGAGHRVTVMATTAGPDQASGTAVSENGFDVVHIAIPRRYPVWFVWLKHPWRLARRAAVELAAVPGRPGRLAPAVAFAALTVVSIPWIAVRAAWDAFSRVALKRPSGPGILDYILRWRAFTLGWARAAAAAAPRADVHHANDMDTLPAALKAARRDRGRVVYDSHEIYLESGVHARQPAWLRWLMARWERSMVAGTEALVTVNPAIADELRRRLHPRRTIVVHNCPPRWDPPSPRSNLLRAVTGISEAAPVVLYHGVFSPHRGLEQLAAALLEPGMERAHAVYLGYGSQRSMLDGLASEPRFGGRLHVLDAVDADVLLNWVAGADVDVIPVQRSTLNHYLSSPNKLFEALAAGVPVAVMDFPYVHAIVLDDPEGPLGTVCDPADPASIAVAIRSILELPDADRAALRGRCLRAAHDRWNWETEAAKLVEFYASLAAG